MLFRSLLFGQRQARKEADDLHPFGYGRSRYFYSFVVALLLFTLGALFAVYEGLHKIEAPEPLQAPLVAIIILGLAVLLEGYSFRTAMAESRELRGSATWWQFIRQAKVPELPIVLLEDTGALFGLVFALLGVVLSLVTGDPVWDGIATVAIGALLGLIAVVLIIEMKSLLIGEGASPEQLRTIVRELEGGNVERVIHIRTQYLGPEEILVAAKIAFSGTATVAEVARSIDEAEIRVRSAVPAARLIYLEPDLDRTAR